MELRVVRDLCTCPHPTAAAARASCGVWALGPGRTEKGGTRRERAGAPGPERRAVSDSGSGGREGWTRSTRSSFVWAPGPGHRSRACGPGWPGRSGSAGPACGPGSPPGLRSTGRARRAGRRSESDRPRLSARAGQRARRSAGAVLGISSQTLDSERYCPHLSFPSLDLVSRPLVPRSWLGTRAGPGRPGADEPGWPARAHSGWHTPPHSDTVT
jgi:hypothetical protein